MPSKLPDTLTDNGTNGEMLDERLLLEFCGSIDAES